HYLSEHPRALKRQNQPVNSKHLSLFNKQTEYYSIASIMKFQLALPIVALVLISTALICSAAWIRPRSAAAYGPRSAAPLRGPRSAAPLRGPRSAAAYGPRSAAPLRGPRSAAPLRGPRSAAPLRGPRSADMDDDSEPDNNVDFIGGINAALDAAGLDADIQTDGQKIVFNAYNKPVATMDIATGNIEPADDSD
ncbi:hypothetical protein BOX15_Mlig028992g1, partial [Macrostomum lignano]